MPDLVTDNQVCIDKVCITWAELASRAEGRGLLARVSSPTNPVAVIVEETAAAFEAVALMAKVSLDGLLLGRERFSEGIRALLADADYRVIEYPYGETTAAAEGARPGTGRIGLLTSGTTGDPKLIHHTWATLFSGGRCLSAKRRRWLVPYQVGTYAWYQLITMGLFQPGQALVPLAAPSGETFIQAALEQGVDSVSSTPTLWRLALLGVPTAQLKELQLKQITLGGEIIDQALLDRLRHLYPEAQVTQIYASSEVGACIVVQDGEAGFPAEMLGKDDSATAALRIQDGSLWVRSPYSASAAIGKGAEWMDTGDRVEKRGSRVVFLGRADSGIINVGGAKLSPGDIEAVILQHPAVSWCRVRGVRAPLVGNLPQADFVVELGCPVPTDDELATLCRTRLPEQGIPRFWNRLDSIPIQANLKSELGR